MEKVQFKRDRTFNKPFPLLLKPGGVSRPIAFRQLGSLACLGLLLATGPLYAQSARPGMGATPYVAGSTRGVTFRVWAPNATNVTVAGTFNDWNQTSHPLVKEGNGNWSADFTNIMAGAEYKYIINNQHWRKDPRALKVVNSAGNNVVFDPAAYDWNVEHFTPPARKDMVTYALHVLTFQPGNVYWPYGTFNMVTEKLNHLQELGVNVIQLMPIAEFPGNNSWGYNPSDIFAVESAYGGPAEFQRFVDNCHARKIAVFLDVVHNHWGPSDLATWQFDGYAPVAEYGGIYHYNTAGLCCTPWGSTRPNYATNPVRSFIKENYSSWIEKFHVDGFRTDSPYHVGYYESSPGTWTLNGDGVSLMQEVNTMLHNNYTNVLSVQENGEASWGFDTRWDMDFLEDLRALVASPDDTTRDMNALAGHINNGAGLGRVVYVESHDTAGDMNGNTRLAKLIDSGDPTSYWSRKRSLLAAAVYMTSPGMPLVFQGEEMMEYWSFSDRTGYRWDAIGSAYHQGHVKAYTDLIHARRNLKGGTQGLKGTGCEVYHVDDNNKVLAYRRWDAGGDDVVVVANFGITAWSNNSYSIQFPSAGTWYVHFNSDRSSYYSDFNDIGPATVTAAGSPATANVNMGRYSALIFSKTPPATSGTSTYYPNNGGCDMPVNVSYYHGGGPLAAASQIQMLASYDNWQTAFTTNMTHNYANTNEWYVSCSGFPGGTRGMTYVFTDGGGNWDNNFGKDWYAPISCYSAAFFDPKEPNSCTNVTIRYEAGEGPLQTATQVYAHVGQNNWELIVTPDMPMTLVGQGVWTCVYSLRDPAYTLNVAFTDGQGGWDTHYNNNWNANVQNCHTNTGSVVLDPTQPYGCGDITFYYEPSTGPLAGSTNINLFIGRDSWQDIVTLPMTNISPGRWSLVFTPLRSTDWINFCFNNGQGVWDNNYTKDWNYSVYCPPQDGVVSTTPENPVGCVPLTFTYQELPECPLENATGVFVYVQNVTDASVITNALPMAEISNGYWRADFYPPPGVQWISYFFHDYAGTIDYRYKTDPWYTEFQGCNPLGSLAITNPINEWYPAGAAPSITLQGRVVSGRSDLLAWTNTLTGQHGTLNGTSNWQIAGVTLLPGTNVITVAGRVYGSSAFDSPTNAAYQDGWQLGDNGGSGFGPWTLEYSSTPFFTMATTSVLGAKAWQVDKPYGWQLCALGRTFNDEVLPGDTLRFKMNLAGQGAGLYQYIDLITSQGHWLGSLAHSPFMSNTVTIWCENYVTLNLPETTAGLDYTIEMLSNTSAWMTITSRSSGQSIEANLLFNANALGAFKKIVLTTMDASNMGGNEYVQYSDLQVVPSAAGFWQSDTINIVCTAAADADGDGMPDDWEDTHGLNSGVNDALADNDGDGVPNRDEYQADTHPANSNSSLRINRIYVAGNDLQIAWQGGSNAVQIIQCATGLQGGWSDLMTNWPPTPISNITSGAGFPRTNNLYFRFKAMRP